MKRAAEITLAIPTRDRPRMVSRLLVPGLKEATASGFPVVIVDQSVGTETRRLVEAIPGVRYLRSEPPLARARNVAVAETTTPLIAFTDDDVAFGADWLDALVTTFAGAPHAGAVCGRARTPAGDLLPGTRSGVYRWPTNPFGLGSGFNLAFRRSALGDAGPFDEELGAGAPYRAAEDTDMLYRILRAGWSVVCADELGLVHHDDRSRDELLHLHFGYGFGAGAQTAKHVAAGDRVAARIALLEAARHVGWLARSLLTLRLATARLQAVFLRGLLAGFRARRRTQRA